MPLAGKRAVITGGSRGIGLAIARAYAEAGADVVIASRKLETCQAVALFGAHMAATDGGSIINVSTIGVLRHRRVRVDHRHIAPRRRRALPSNQLIEEEVDPHD
jgi:nucleoside-diphosphate-sugar epimerase